MCVQHTAGKATPEGRNGNINLNKYFISSDGSRTHNQLCLQSHFVTLCHDRPLIIICIYFEFKFPLIILLYGIMRESKKTVHPGETMPRINKEIIICIYVMYVIEKK